MATLQLLWERIAAIVQHVGWLYNIRTVELDLIAQYLGLAAFFGRQTLTSRKLPKPNVLHYIRTSLDGCVFSRFKIHNKFSICTNTIHYTAHTVMSCTYVHRGNLHTRVHTQCRFEPGRDCCFLRLLPASYFAFWRTIVSYCLFVYLYVIKYKITMRPRINVLTIKF